MNGRQALRREAYGEDLSRAAAATGYAGVGRVERFRFVRTVAAWLKGSRSSSKQSVAFGVLMVPGGSGIRATGSRAQYRAGKRSARRSGTPPKHSFRPCGRNRRARLAEARREMPL